MTMTDKSRSNELNGDSIKKTPDRRFAYRKFIYSLLIGSIQDLKKGGKMEIEAIKWLASESAGEILEDVDINRKDILYYQTRKDNQ